MTASAVIPAILEQHAEELATLWMARDGLRAAAGIGLRELARFDERISAHEDACVVAGDEALRVLNAQLETVSAGSLFASAVVALDLNHRQTTDRCLALAEAVEDARRGMTAALGWVSAGRLRGIVRDMLSAPSDAVRSLGLAACRVHGVDPGSALHAGLKSSSVQVRAEGLRAAGVLGHADLASSLAAGLDRDPVCQFWSAWSSVLLGDRGKGLNALTSLALAGSYGHARAFLLSCQAMKTATAHEILSRLAADPTQARRVIEGAGVVGDPVYVPWLITRMADDRLSRLAGESFTLITGADLVSLHLERDRPADFKSGPNDDPNDPAVAMDGDDGLPWPDPAKVLAWWEANGKRFEPGHRWFMGARPTRDHCIGVLKGGYQRQRVLAAQLLCLLEPGTVLLNTSAAAPRQEQLLARM